MNISKLLAASLIAISSSVLAEENKFYGGIELGYVNADTGADETAQYLANLIGQTVSYTYEDSAAIGRIFLGYDLDKTTSFEVGYFATGDTENTYTTAGGAGTGSAVEDFSVSGLDMSVIFRPSKEGLFLRLGGHYSEIESTAALSFGGVGYSLTASGWATAWGTGLLGGLGYDYAMKDSDMKIRGSYTYYNGLGGVSGANMHTLNVGLLF
tara:strand:+ start:108 stop:740 length:633 start_codon:yes stop_codon:yes gene_type:complete